MGDSPTVSRGRVVALVAAVVVVVGSLVAWSATRGDDDPGSTPGAGSTPTSTPTSTPSASSTTPAVPTPTGSDGEVLTPSPGTSLTPGKGETVPVEPVKTKKPVPLAATADFGTGLSVELAGIKAVKGVARAPGEISGPALQVTVEASNSSGKAIPLDHVVVFLSYGKDRTPSSRLSKGTSELGGSLAVGARKSGVYVFTVPTDERDNVRVEVSYTGQAPTVAFQGSVAS